MSSRRSEKKSIRRPLALIVLSTVAVLVIISLLTSSGLVETRLLQSKVAGGGGACYLGTGYCFEVKNKRSCDKAAKIDVDKGRIEGGKDKNLPAWAYYPGEKCLDKGDYCFVSVIPNNPRPTFNPKNEGYNPRYCRSQKTVERMKDICLGQLTKKVGKCGCPEGKIPIMHNPPSTDTNGPKDAPKNRCSVSCAAVVYCGPNPSESPDPG